MKTFPPEQAPINSAVAQVGMFDFHTHIVHDAIIEGLFVGQSYAKHPTNRVFHKEGVSEQIKFHAL